MPQTIKHRISSRRAGRNTGKRNRKAQPGRKRCRGEKKNAAGVIGNSIFALKLSVIPGVIVEQAIKRKGRVSWEKDDDYEKMYYDLFGAYKNYCKLLGNDSIEFDPLKSGINLSQSCYMITNRIKELVPKAWKFNIDRHGDSYCFTIFKDLDLSNYWHHFNIEPVVKFLVKKNKELHDLFLSAIAVLAAMDIQTWYSGNLYATDVLMDEYNIMDYIECRIDEESGVDEKMAEVNALRTNYSSGEVAAYQRLINNSFIKPEVLKKITARLKVRNPIKKWILQVADLAGQGYMLRDFIYEIGEDQDNDGALRLEDQITILWSDKDFVFDITSEYMDNDAANFGTEYPVYHFSIDKRTKNAPFEKMYRAQNWISGITDLFNSYQDVLKYIKYE